MSDHTEVVRRVIRLAWYHLRGMHYAAMAEAQEIAHLESSIGVRKTVAGIRAYPGHEEALETWSADPGPPTMTYFEKGKPAP